jgi:hypothetical protein
MRTPTILWSATGALLLLTLTACGGGTSSSDSSSATVAATPAAASGAAGGRPDFTAYRDCLATNGVTLPDGGQGGPAGGGFPSGVPSGFPSGFPSGDPGAFPSGGAPSGAGPGGGFPLPDGVDQATYDKAQAACASVRPSFGPGGGRPAFDQTAVAAFKSCLSDHAVTVPDGDNWMQQLDRTDATVKSALDTCAPLLPQPSNSQ